MHKQKYKIQRIEYPEDPERCQAMAALGQCQIKAMPGVKYCPIHGGNHELAAKEKASIFKYRVARYQGRLDSLADSNAIKSLRDELAITRFLVQKVLDLGDLPTYASIISRLVKAIEGLALACAKVETSLANVMDHSSAVTQAKNLLIATQMHVSDSEIIDPLIVDITSLLDRLHRHQSGSKASNYVLKHWESEVSSFLSSERVISLRNEIAVSRILVEERLTACRTPNDLLFSAQTILSHIQTIQSLVLSCHKLEASMGLMLDKDEVAQFGSELITIVGNYITDGEILERISKSFASLSDNHASDHTNHEPDCVNHESDHESDHESVDNT